MTLLKLRNSLGVTVILGHFAVLGLLVVGFLRERFLFPEFTTTAALIVPVFAGYTTTIVRFIMKNPVGGGSASATHVSGTYVFVSFFFPTLMIIACGGLVMMKGNLKPLTDFENFKGSLAILETVLASYVGLVIAPLFRK